ncbi:DUF4233 domain-containing protein [Nocardioides sp. Bht2]|uniref:DUF4233 domain-containing protein n=1 Tax=Nocardioides sp. Bht2 TaxID=3392297 RepID=UPI0039B4AFBC
MSTEQPADPATTELPAEAQKSPRRAMCAAILSLEAIMLGLSSAVMISLADVAPAVALSIGLGLCVLCFLVAGMLRAEWAYWAGTAIQVAAVALGFVVPIMFFLGGLFALLWGSAYYLGRKIERERGAAWAEWAAEQ